MSPGSQERRLAVCLSYGEGHLPSQGLILPPALTYVRALHYSKLLGSRLSFSRDLIHPPGFPLPLPAIPQLLPPQGGDTRQPVGLFNARKGSWSPETPFLTASRAGGRSKPAAQGNRGIVSTRTLKFRQAAQRTRSDLRLFRGTRFQNNTFRGGKVMTTLALLSWDK